jgi:acyl carrier protein
MTRDEIEATMRALVADSLAVPKQSVTVRSRLLDDLGANSLDFIDIVFSIEKAFGITVRDSELDFLSRLDFSSPAVMRDGHLTRETVDRLADWLPLLRDVADRAGLTPRELFSLIDVEALCILVERKLGPPAG